MSESLPSEGVPPLPAEWPAEAVTTRWETESEPARPQYRAAQRTRVVVVNGQKLSIVAPLAPGLTVEAAVRVAEAVLTDRLALSIVAACQRRWGTGVLKHVEGDRWTYEAAT